MGRIDANPDNREKYAEKIAVRERRNKKLKAISSHVIPEYKRTNGGREHEIFNELSVSDVYEIIISQSNRIRTWRIFLLGREKYLPIP